MGDKSAIEWTDATWNPVTGCSKVSPGCANCYAEALSLRYGWSKQPWTPDNAAANVILHPERLDLPLRWRTPRRIFVNSMSDLFHERVPDAFIDSVFARMVDARQHTFQVLTKRPERMQAYVKDAWPHLPIYPHIWLGTSVENQHWADIRIGPLVGTPAAVHFLSCEPLLGPLDLQLEGRNYGRDYANWSECVDWVIAGGESGPHFRPVNPAWVQTLQLQCQIAGVPFLFKQWGGRTPKAGGRLLDGREWNEYPEVWV